MKLFIFKLNSPWLICLMGISSVYFLSWLPFAPFKPISSPMICQILFLSILFFTFYFRVRKNIFWNQLWKVILYGCVMGYLSSVFSYFCFYVFFHFHRIEKMIWYINHLPFRFLAVIFIIPIAFRGWFYGALMGLFVWLFQRVHNTPDATRKK